MFGGRGGWSAGSLDVGRDRVELCGFGWGLFLLSVLLFFR